MGKKKYSEYFGAEGSLKAALGKMTT